MLPASARLRMTLLAGVAASRRDYLVLVFLPEGEPGCVIRRQRLNHELGRNAKSSEADFSLSHTRVRAETDFTILHTEVRGGRGLPTSATSIRNSGTFPIVDYPAWPITRAYTSMTSA